MGGYKAGSFQQKHILTSNKKPAYEEGLGNPHRTFCLRHVFIDKTSETDKLYKKLITDNTPTNSTQ